MYALICPTGFDSYDAPEVYVFSTREEALALYERLADADYIEQMRSVEEAYNEDPDFWVVKVSVA